MPHRVVIEIEAGALSLTVARQRRGGSQVLRCARRPLPDPTAEAMAAVLVQLIADAPLPTRDVHVLLGSHGLMHFAVQTPRLSDDVLRDLVVREARRHGALAADTAIVAHVRAGGPDRGSLASLAVCAASVAVVDPVLAACARAGLRVRSLTSVEDGLAAAAAGRRECAAVLEVVGGRIRFVTCRAGIPFLSRRFLVAGGEAADPEAISAQLLLEIPRTLDWLREQDAPPPERLLVGHRSSLRPADLAQLQELGMPVARLAAAVAVDQGIATPSLSTVGLLRRLHEDGGGLGSLHLGGVHLRLRRSRTQVARDAALVAVALAGGALAVERWQRLQPLLVQREQGAAEIARLQDALSAEAGAAPGGETASRSVVDAAVLGRRRPYSLALARLCELVPDGVRLTELRLDDDRLTLTGRATGTSRLAALSSLQRFASVLRAVSWLGGGRDVVEDAVDGAAVGFVFERVWRRP